MSDRDTTRERARIRDALGPVMDRDAAELGPHPAFEELVRYHGGELDEGAAEAVQHHVVACSECLENLLDLDQFVEAGAGRGEGLAERGGGAALLSPFGVGRRAAMALAASFLVAVSLLAVWVVRERTAADDLRRQVATLSAPRPDVPIVDLLPDSAVRGEGGGRAPVELPADRETFTLVLGLPGTPEPGAFEAELLDAEGRVSWRGPLEPSPFGTFTLGLSRRSLEAGEHTIRLYRIDGAGSSEEGPGRPVETYTFRVPPSQGAD